MIAFKMDIDIQTLIRVTNVYTCACCRACCGCETNCNVLIEVVLIMSLIGRWLGAHALCLL